MLIALSEIARAHAVEKLNQALADTIAPSGGDSCCGRLRFRRDRSVSASGSPSAVTQLGACFTCSAHQGAPKNGSCCRRAAAPRCMRSHAGSPPPPLTRQLRRPSTRCTQVTCAAWRWPLRASGIDAARHLLRVAAGLESIVVGDVQLLGQLRTAYAIARAEHTTGPLLNRLCQTALHAGKRSRAETGIATGAASMAAAAVQQALRDDDGQAKRHFLIVGGGQMGRAIATALHSRRCENVTVATRDPDAFASTGGTRFASVVPRSAIAGCLSQADVLFAASGAVTQRLTTEAIARSMAGRDRRPMLILDLAMPRQVDPDAASVPGVRLVTLEALERVLSLATRSRSDAVKEVERIVEEALVRMLAWSPHAQHTVSRLSTLDPCSAPPASRDTVHAWRHTRWETISRTSTHVPGDRRHAVWSAGCTRSGRCDDTLDGTATLNELCTVCTHAHESRRIVALTQHRPRLGRLRGRQGQHVRDQPTTTHPSH